MADSTGKVSAEQKKFFITPIISYQPETSWAFGAGAIYNFKPNNHFLPGTSGFTADSLVLSRTFSSKLTGIAFYTLENQFQFEAGGDIYTRDNQWFVSANFAFYRYPASFFGIGNNTLSENEERYTNTHPYIRLHAQKNISGNMYAGGKLFFEHTKISDIDSGTILYTEDITGEAGGLNTGIGPWITYDTRNHAHYPSSGVKAELSTVFHNKIFGSAYTYVDNVIEVSYFIPTFQKQVLAFNSYNKFLSGNPPFNRMAELGGASRMRGNYEGRFRDKQYFSLQTEYRFQIGRFFAVHAFAGAGEVAVTFSEFTIEGLHYSFGGGGRFFIVPEEKISLRIDYAFGSKSVYDTEKGKNIFDRGLYVTIGEAF